MIMTMMIQAGQKVRNAGKNPFLHSDRDGGGGENRDFKLFSTLLLADFRFNYTASNSQKLQLNPYQAFGSPEPAAKSSPNHPTGAHKSTWEPLSVAVPKNTRGKP